MARPVFRSHLLTPWIDRLSRLGGSTDSLLRRAGVRPDVLRSPTAVIPLDKGLHFIDLACEHLGTEHLGLLVGREITYESLGAYGQLLARSFTFYDYLQKGVALYNTMMLGQSLRLTRNGPNVRLEMVTPWDPGLADFQSFLSTFVVTIGNVRAFFGSRCTPSEICFAYQAQEPMPESEAFSDSRIVSGPGPSYLEFPGSMLVLPNRLERRSGVGAGLEIDAPIPEDLVGLVKLQIDALLSRGPVSVGLVADSLGMSRRSLQRELAARGGSYSTLLGEVRTRSAVDWLKRTDKPVLDIAMELGYTDAANFTRAFRRRTGVSPTSYRRSMTSIETH